MDTYFRFRTRSYRRRSWQSRKTIKIQAMVDVEQVIDGIMSSYANCKTKKITSILFIALHVFRRSLLGYLTSELDCMIAVVGPILQEIMDIQHNIKFTWYCFLLICMFAVTTLSLIYH
jgi:predicted ferric reductase